MNIPVRYIDDVVIWQVVGECRHNHTRIEIIDGGDSHLDQQALVCQSCELVIMTLADEREPLDWEYED